MSFYTDNKTFCTAMTDLFRQGLALPGVSQSLSQTGLMLHLIATDPAATLALNGRSQPPEFTCTASNAKPDFAIHLSADLLHQMLLGQVNVQDAFMAGKLKLEGPLLRAMSLASHLTDLFRQIETLYPQVLRNHGLL